MTWALLATAASALSFAGTSVWLAIRLANRSDAMHMVSQELLSTELELNRARDAIDELEDRAARQRQLLDGRGRELEWLHAELEQCGSEDERGRRAVAAIKRLLSPGEAESTATDSD